MADRPAFFVHQGKAVCKSFSFQWFPGFAASQKQKSVESLHGAIRKENPGANPLEVSTKSTDPLGRKLSAFRLALGGRPLENVFQSAKVFENGGPYLDLLDVPPKEAKRDERLKSSGKLAAFCFQGERFPLVPTTAFYDYIYLKAVKESLEPGEIRAVSDYDFFTDIEFNPARSVNTQARTVSILKLLLEEFQTLPDFSREEFLQYHKDHIIYDTTG